MKAEKVIVLSLSETEAKAIFKLVQGSGKPRFKLTMDESCILTELEMTIGEVIDD